MALLIALFIVLVGGAVTAAILLVRSGRSVSIGGPSAWGRAATQRFGRIGGPVFVFLTGWIATFAVGLALGFLAKATQSGLDEPVFRWVHGHVKANHFTTLNEKLTLTGNTPTIELVCLFAGVLLAIAYGRRAWWFPVIGIVVFFFTERYIQKYLGTIVDRGHPPTTHGTYPSGGVCRILGVYGGILALAIALFPLLRRSWRNGLWAGLIITAVVECYTRVYLSLHWFTDALFALPVGTLMLLTNLAAVGALDPLTSRAPTHANPAAREPAPA